MIYVDNLSSICYHIPKGVNKLEYVVATPIKYRDKIKIAYKHDVVWYLHIHRGVELVFVTEGTLRMQIGSEICDIPKGSVAFIDSFEPHSFIAAESNESYIFDFALEQVDPFLRWASSNKLVSKVVPLDIPLIEYVSSILPKSHDMCGAMSEINMLAALVPLCNAVCERGEWSGEAKEYSDLFIKTASYISDHFADPLTRDTVAKAIGVCPETISRTFSQQSEFSFIEFVHRIRIYEAIRFMEGGLSITEAAFRSGFESVRSFNRVFREVMDTNPSEYLKQF